VNTASSMPKTAALKTSAVTNVSVEADLALLTLDMVSSGSKERDDGGEAIKIIPGG
jgi:hypothetical protein